MRKRLAGRQGRRYPTALFLLFSVGCIVLLIDTGMCQSDGTGILWATRNLFSPNGGASGDAAKTSGNFVPAEIEARRRADALLFRGMHLQFDCNQIEKALCLFNEVLRYYPESSAAGDALFHTGVIYDAQGKNEKARKAFLAYLQKYPQGIRKTSAMAWYQHILDRINKPVAFKVDTSGDDNFIRVLIEKNEKELMFTSDTPLDVYDLDTGHHLGNDAKMVVFQTDGDHVSIQNRPVSGCRFKVTTPAEFITVGAYHCRGEYLVSMDKGGLTVVNRVHLEDYLYSIVPKEMPHTWPKEALMAQAVASRTYALYLKKQSAHLPFDVAATTDSQVYGGVLAEKETTTRAVNATRGQVLTYHDHLVAAYFHANSAGHTEDARQVWDIDAPYLKGKPDKYSANAPDEVWQCYLSYDEIAECCSKSGVAVGRVLGVKVTDVSANGRNLTITVLTDAGIAEMTGNHFRLKMDPVRIRSTHFQIIPKNKGVLISGKGYGHGVGMSQWGAQRMAREGLPYQNILTYYYPGAVVSKEDG